MVFLAHWCMRNGKMRHVPFISSLLAGKTKKRFARVALEPVVDGCLRDGFVGNPLSLRGLFLS